MPWTNGRPFPPAETRSLYAHWWLEHLDPETRGRTPLDTSDLPRVRPVHLVEDDGWISAAYAPDPRAAAAAAGPPAAEESTEAPGLLDVLVHSERENGPVPIVLPGDVFNRDPTVGARWECVAAPADGSVIVAIIDDAIGFANARFRRRSGPGSSPVSTISGCRAWRPRPPSGLPFGRELTGPDIDALLQQFTRGGLVDEQALYREIGFVDFRSSSVQSAASAVSHGTAVADRAGGHRDPNSEFAEMVTLMGACLPSQVIGDTSGTFIELFMIAAIERIRRRVRWLEQASGRRYPLIINMSFALTAGNVSPAANTVVWHRRGLLDTYLRYAVADHYAGPGPHAPLFFIGPAGNHRLARTHAVVRPGPHPPLRWRVLPDDRTPELHRAVVGPGDLAVGADHPLLAASAGRQRSAPPPPSVAFDQFSELVINGRVYAAAHYSWYPETRLCRKAPVASVCSSRSGRRHPSGLGSRRSKRRLGPSRSSVRPSGSTCASSVTIASPATGNGAASPSSSTIPTGSTTRQVARSRSTTARDW